jgi:molecular chaperone GrpE
MLYQGRFAGSIYISIKKRFFMSNYNEKLSEISPALSEETSAGIEAENFNTGNADPVQMNAGAETPEERADGAGGSEAPPEGDPWKRIAELEKQLAELNDQYLRKAADFENFRKRIIKEKNEAVEFANQSLLLELIATLDDFERAINSAGTSEKTEADFEAFREGVVMVEKKLLGQLENKWGLKRFESAGTPFDPTRHEALFMEKSAGVSEPVVQEDFAKGYMLKDRVVRPAKVKVLMPETAQEKQG